MSEIIRCKIDRNKVAKEHLYEGEKGTYLNVDLLPAKPGGKTDEFSRPVDNYGNHFMIVQQVSREAREKGIKGPIVGNAKYAGGKAAPKPVAKPASPIPADVMPPEDDVPF